MTSAGGLQAAILQFTRSQAQRGINAVALEVVERDRRPVVRGTVLTPRQAREVRDLARRDGATAELVVAADPRSEMEQGWVETVVPVLNLWRDPSRAGHEMGRQTQYTDADGPLRSFGMADDFQLLQGADLAMGWARSEEVRSAKPAGDRHPWAGIVRAEGNLVRRPARDIPGADTVLERARREIDVPYVWGGTTHSGFDCSGLLQRVFLDSTGVLLPRHTGDLRRVGGRVVGEDVRPGDLLFAAPRQQKVGHVLLMTSAGSVLHACRTEHRVIEESLSENARRYLHQGWRRPVRLDAAA